jgi:SAP domain
MNGSASNGNDPRPNRPAAANQAPAAAPASPQMTTTIYSSIIANQLRVPELKLLLEHLSLSKQGNKPALIDRLIVGVRDNPQY